MNFMVVRTVGALAALQAAALAQLTWNQVATSGPSARSLPAVAFDSARGRFVLFGGYNGSYLGDTWELTGTNWVLVSTSGPTSRWGATMAFDSQRQRTVLFGGYRNVGLGVYPADTWEWDGTAWIQVAATGPAPRNYSSMVFDEQRGKAVLFGGYNETSGNAFLGDTWEWDGTVWNQVGATGPLAREGHSMAFDTARSRTVLFGGNQGTGTLLHDTWEWDGSAWSLVATTGPAPRNYSRMAFDRQQGVAVLFGGNDGSASYLGDTWSWDGTTWTQQSGPGPAGRMYHALAHDTHRGVTALFGGYNLPLGVLGDTWELRTPPPPVLAIASTYGTGCSSPVPSLAPRNSSRPLLGQIQLSDITNVPFGFAAVVWGVTQQSLLLDFVGINGCTLLNGGEFEIGSFCQSTSFTSAQHSLAIPYDLTLLGLQVYLQAWTIAPGFNPLGIALSNGLELVIGDV